VTDNREPNGGAEKTTEETEAPEVVDMTAAEAASTEHDDSLRDAVGAYLLDALPEDERRAFETYLASSPETQEEIRQLTPVVTLLPMLLESESAEHSNAPAPTDELRERIVRGAQAERLAPTTAAEATDPAESVALEPEAAAEESAEEARTRTIRTAPQGTGPFESRRRAARARGTAARPNARTTPSPFAQIPTPWLAAAAVTVIAIGAIIWALALQSRIDSKNREITAQSAELAQLRTNANATAFTLFAPSGQSAQAGGTLLFSPQDQIGVLSVRSLPALTENQVYQLWYLDDQGNAPRPGATFRIDRNGNGLVMVAADTPSFDEIALTAEPDGGSQAPTSDIVLQGRVGGAAG
jgi:hypothetical protein